MHKIKPIPIVIACLTCGNEILLLKRNKDPFIDQWSLPGGKIDSGEHTDQAVKREIKEETGIDLLCPVYQGLVSELIFDGADHNILLYHHLVHVFAASVERKDYYTCPEGELAWFAFDRLKLIKDEMVITDFYIIDEMLLKKHPGLYNSLVYYRSKRYDIQQFDLRSPLT